MPTLKEMMASPYYPAGVYYGTVPASGGSLYIPELSVVERHGQFWIVPTLMNARLLVRHSITPALPGKYVRIGRVWAAEAVLSVKTEAHDIAYSLNLADSEYYLMNGAGDAPTWRIVNGQKLYWIGESERETYRQYVAARRGQSWPERPTTPTEVVYVPSCNEEEKASTAMSNINFEVTTVTMKEGVYALVSTTSAKTLQSVILWQDGPYTDDEDLTVEGAKSARQKAILAGQNKVDEVLAGLFT